MPNPYNVMVEERNESVTKEVSRNTVFNIIVYLQNGSFTLMLRILYSLKKEISIHIQ